MPPNQPIPQFQPPTLVIPPGMRKIPEFELLTEHLTRYEKYLLDYIQSHAQVTNTGTQGFGKNIVSADTIGFSNFIHVVTGTATINSITAPANFSGLLCLVSRDGFSLGGAGNIKSTPQTLTASSLALLLYLPATAGWYVLITLSNIGQLTDIPTSAAVSPAVAGTGISVATNPVKINNTGVLSVAGTANQVSSTGGQNPVLSLPATITGPTRYTGINAPSVSGDALSEGHAIGAAAEAAIATNSLKVDTQVAQGSGLKHQRVTTGSIGAGVTAAVTLTWTAAFADASYTVAVSVLEASGSLTVVGITAQSNTQIVVNVKNNDGANAHTGTLMAVALHD